MGDRENFEECLDYKVNLNIVKYNTLEAFDRGVPDEVLNIPGNCLTKKGINLIWKTLTGASLDSTAGEKYFNGTNSYIGVGNASTKPEGRTHNTTQSIVTEPTSDDLMLSAEENYKTKSDYDVLPIKFHDPHYCYIGMSDQTQFPEAGNNQKIVFQSTFAPGVACFNWFEWCIANGNGNLNETLMRDDNFIVMMEPITLENMESYGCDTEDPGPDPLPTVDQYCPTDKATIASMDKILLNHRIEQMGRKYGKATWMITVEVSLS